MDTKQMGQQGYPKNQIKVTMSYYNPGTKLTLVFHDIPTKKNKLETLLSDALNKEDYDKACILRDLIKENN